MARVRVTNVEDVPQFIVYSDSTNVQGDSWTIQGEVLQYIELGNEPPIEDAVPDELEVENPAPYDFMGLGQPVIQQGHDQHNEQEDQDAPDQNNNQQNQQEQNLNLNLNGGGLNQQQPNTWEPWFAWPQAAQQQAQQAQGQNAQAQQAQAQNIQPQQDDAMQLDLNLPVNDLLEVIINPAHPPINNEFIELNDVMEEEEEIIPQPVNQEGINEPVQQELLNGNDNLQIVNGFPIPQIPDVIGEEIPLDQLMGQNAEEEEAEDLVLNLLVGPGEEGFPVNNGGAQLPENQDELLLMQLADQEMQGNLARAAENNPQQLIHVEEQVPQPIQVEEQQPHQPNLQTGMALMPQDQWAATNRNLLLAAKKPEAIQMWERLTQKGNFENFLVRVPSNWVPFFNIMLSAPDKFDWTKKFLTSGVTSYLEGKDGNYTLPLPKTCHPTAPVHCPDNIYSPDHDMTENNVGKNNSVLDKNADAPLTGGNEKKSKKSKKRLTPVVENQVRRSERVRLANDGYKSDCTKRNCRSCNPPTLTTKIIRNLGTQFCSMEEEELQEKKLLNGDTAREPVAKKKAKTRENKNKGKKEAEAKMIQEADAADGAPGSQ